VKILSIISSYCSTSSLPPTLRALHSQPCSTIDTHHSLSSLTIRSRYIHQLLDGVQFLHDSNFVHRDLKLENLMIDACGCLKIGQANFPAATIPNVFASCKLQSQATSV
jgi:serine/threonine protein kinase